MQSATVTGAIPVMGHGEANAIREIVALPVVLLLLHPVPDGPVPEAVDYPQSLPFLP